MFALVTYSFAKYSCLLLPITPFSLAAHFGMLLGRSPPNGTVYTDYVNCGTSFAVSAYEGSNTEGPGHGADGHPFPPHPNGAYTINVSVSVLPLYPSPGFDIEEGSVRNVERNSERVRGLQNGVEVKGLKVGRTGGNRQRALDS